MNRSAPPVALEVRASRWQLALIVVSCVAAVAAVWIARLPFAVQLSASALAIAFSIQAWLKARRWHAAHCVFESDEPSRIRFADGTVHEARIVDATLLGPLVALRLELDGRRADLALFPDSAAPDDLRRLRVLLRHGVKL